MSSQNAEIPVAVLQPRAAAVSRPTRSANPWLIAVTVTLATFMELLDTAIANVSLPHIAGGLATSYDESTWVLTSYLVANAIVLPLSAWLSRVFGRKNCYMACVALFTLSSLMCGLAPSLGLLIFFRVLQGVGGGGLAPVEQAILVDTFPASKRAAAFALYSMAIVTAPAIGPPRGRLDHGQFLLAVGLLYQCADWFDLTFPQQPAGERSSSVQGGSGRSQAAGQAER